MKPTVIYDYDPIKLIPVSVDELKADAIGIRDAGLGLLAFLATNGLLPDEPAPLPPRAHKTKAARKKRRKKLLEGKTLGS